MATTFQKAPEQLKVEVPMMLYDKNDELIDIVMVPLVEGEADEVWNVSPEFMDINLLELDTPVTRMRLETPIGCFETLLHIPVGTAIRFVDKDSKNAAEWWKC